MIIKHLSAHVFIFSIAMALENVQNLFFGLKTVKVLLKQVFELEKGQISALPLEIQRTYLWKVSRAVLPGVVKGQCQLRCPSWSLQAKQKDCMFTQTHRCNLQQITEKMVVPLS